MDIQQLYSVRFESPEVLAKKNKIWQVLCKYFFQKYIPEESLVLDIASGYCEFINNIKAKEKIAFDLNPDVKSFAGKDVQVVNDSFFNMESHLQGKKADIIFASNIFEHLDDRDQVILAIKTCAENLKKPIPANQSATGIKQEGGKLLILHPDIAYTGPAYWDFIDHKVALTGRTLIEVAEICGLKTKYHLRKFLPYTTKSKFPQYPFFVWLYLKLMPISNLFMGQQTFLIFERIDE
jgi:hypothetical protein